MRSVTPTLLIDLDDTLLGNDMNVFLPAYLKALAARLAAYAPPEQLIPTLLAATRTMLENNRPDRTLKQVFDAAFYPALGLRAEDLQSELKDFYAEVFPTLEGYTQRWPQASELVAGALRRGFRLVIATNPLFPRAAILHRLRWAGLAPEKYQFELVTSYETFHFSKPNPAYFAEILARLGWPEDPVVVIGNDPHNDIDPARRLGLPAFWVSAAQDGGYPRDARPPAASGPLEAALPWLEAAPPGALEPDFGAPEAILATLRATPAALAVLCGDLSEQTWSHHPKEGEWNLTEILCHLRDVEGEVNLPRLKKVIEETNPFLPGMDTDPWAAERLYFCQNGPEALQDFTAFRLELLDLLASLGPGDWEKPARHAIFGPTHLRELAGINAGHDRMHLRQLRESLETLNLDPCLSAC
jgi:FMN phosphatase YigB (HAD superfamily)